MPVFRIFLLLLFLLNGIPVFSQEAASIQQSNIKESKRKIDSEISILQKKELVEIQKSANKKIVSLYIVLVIMLMVLVYFVYQNDKLKKKISKKIFSKKYNSTSSMPE